MEVLNGKFIHKFMIFHATFDYRRVTQRVSTAASITRWQCSTWGDLGTLQSPTWSWRGVGFLTAVFLCYEWTTNSIKTHIITYQNVMCIWNNVYIYISVCVCLFEIYRDIERYWNVHVCNAILNLGMSAVSTMDSGLTPRWKNLENTAAESFTTLDLSDRCAHLETFCDCVHSIEDPQEYPIPNLQLILLYTVYFRSSRYISDISIYNSHWQPKNLWILTLLQIIVPCINTLVPLAPICQEA